MILDFLQTFNWDLITLLAGLAVVFAFIAMALMLRDRKGGEE